MNYIAVYEEDLENVRELLNHNEIEFQDEPYPWDIAFREALRDRYELLTEDDIDYMVDVISNDPYLFEQIEESLDDLYKEYMLDKCEE